MIITAWANIDGIKDGTLAVVGLGDERFQLIGRAANYDEARKIAADACMDFYATRIVQPDASAVWTEAMEDAAEDDALDEAAAYWLQVAKEAGAKMVLDLDEAQEVLARIEAEAREAA